MSSSPGSSTRYSRATVGAVSRANFRSTVVALFVLVFLNYIFYLGPSILKLTTPTTSDHDDKSVVAAEAGSTSVGLNSCSQHATPRNVFLDVGSNRGDVLQAFYEKKHRHKSTNPAWKFGIQPYDPQEWLVYGFEASPVHKDTLVALQQKYSPNLTVIHPFALWNKTNETVTLQIDVSPKGQIFGQYGTSIFLNWTYNGEYQAVDVSTIDFGEWMLQHLCKEDLIYMKMNVEGAEFVLVKQMMELGLLCWLDHIDLYWHASFMGEGKDEAEKLIKLTEQYIDLVCPAISRHTWSKH